MSEAVTTHGAALLSLLRSGRTGAPAPPAMLYRLADLLAEEGRFDDFADVYRQAFQRMPMMRPALDDDASVPLAARAARLRRLAQALVDREVRYAPVLAALAVAEAMTGNQPAVRRLIDYQRFFRPGAAGPDIYLGGEGFSAALEREIRTKLAFESGQSRTPLRGGWRHDGILDSRTRACRALKREISRQVDRYMTELPDDPDHPFVAARPRRFSLHSWAVVAGAETHIEPHIHLRAWLSGVYYVASDRLEPERGWLEVGPPAGVSPSTGWEQRLIEPTPGRLVLMPGYFFHSTSPTRSESDRICIAFNVTPLELAHKGEGSEDY
jgi:hypothetical protein